MSQKSKQQNKQAATEKVRVAFTAVGWEQFEYWRAADDKIHSAIVRLIEECCRTPFAGLGKPEALRGDLSGYWSRRITKEHRFVYCVTDGVLQVISCRYHY